MMMNDIYIYMYCIHSYTEGKAMVLWSLPVAEAPTICARSPIGLDTNERYEYVAGHRSDHILVHKIQDYTSGFLLMGLFELCYCF